MSENSNESRPGADNDLEPEQQEIADVQAQLDARSDEEGLGAEAGSGEEAGLAEG